MSFRDRPTALRFQTLCVQFLLLLSWQMWFFRLHVARSFKKWRPKWRPCCKILYTPHLLSRIRCISNCRLDSNEIRRLIFIGVWSSAEEGPHTWGSPTHATVVSIKYEQFHLIAHFSTKFNYNFLKFHIVHTVMNYMHLLFIPWRLNDWFKSGSSWERCGSKWNDVIYSIHFLVFYWITIVKCAILSRWA